MEWQEIARENLAAARHEQERGPRSSVSRAYYAFHCLLTHILVDAGYRPAGNRQTPPHLAQANLIGRYLGVRGALFVRDARAILRRLYHLRLDADYNRRVTIDSRVALQAVRDAHRAFKLMEVLP